MQNIGKGFVAGLVANLVLSALMVMKSAMGLMPELDVIGMLGGMMNTTRAVAWLVHFAVGIVIYGGAIALLAGSLPGGATGSGVTLGVIGWLIMMIVIMPMVGQGLFGMGLGVMAPVMTLVLHLIFGAVLGSTFGKLTSRETVSLR